MRDRPSTAKSRLALPILTLAVVSLHAWLLQVGPAALGGSEMADETTFPSFVTRTVVAPPDNTPNTTAGAPPSTQPTPAPRAVPASPAPKPAAPSLKTELARPPSRASLTSLPPPDDVSETAAPLTPADAPEAQDPNPQADHPENAPPPAQLQEAQAPLATPALADATRPLPPATELPAPVRLKYAVTANKFPYSLNAELLWQHDSSSYNARLVFGAFGQSRVQTSQGDLDPHGLAPTRFSDKYRTELAAHFNRTLNKITFSANTPDAPLMTGAQDRLSVLVQLATLLASDPGGYPQATTITVQTAGPREASPWLFTVQAPEKLLLPGGEQDTLKLVRLPRRDYDQKVELWLAPALGYLPARIRITEHNGDYIDQQWLTSEPAL